MLPFRKNNLNNIELCNFLSEIGFNEEEILSIVFDPSFFITYYDKMDIMVKEGYQYLIDKNFEKEQIRKIILRYPGILTFSKEKKEKVENYFSKLGITLAEFRKIVYRCPNIYGYTIERTESYINYFKELGYPDDDIKYIIKNSSSLFNRSIITLKTLINDLMNYGIDKFKILNMGRNYPLLWTCSFDKIKSVIETLINLGFEKNQAINIISTASSLIGYDIDHIKEKFNSIISLGFNQVAVISMINTFPSLITCDINRTKKIVAFFTHINLKDKIVEKPKSIFKQSIETTYARYMFLKDNSVEINENTYGRLFFGWIWYKKKYGVTKETLLLKYPYNIEEKPPIK